MDRSDYTSSSSGVNASEEYLISLCQNTFLRLWSYPNTFRDQGKTTENGDGKELCDLLVIFGDHVIVFSDKRCEFTQSATLEIAWCRWYKKAISNSLRQLSGAGRWVKEFPDRIFMDKKCKKELPISIPDPDNLVFHYVLVASGAAEACGDFYRSGGNASLMISPDRVDPVYDPDKPGDHQPFLVGPITTQSGEYVHLFDEYSLSLVMNELDTAQDFINYLAAKEKLFNEGKMFGAAGEEELLAIYLQLKYKGAGSEFEFADDYDSIFISEGAWASLQSDPGYLRAKKLNHVSSLVDMLIEEVTDHLEGNTLRDFRGFESTERALRELATRTRFERRVISQSLFELVAGSDDVQQFKFRSVHLRQGHSVLYVFAVASMSIGKNLEQYYARRRTVLTAYCQIVAINHPEYDQVMGIATESGLTGAKSHDILLLRNGEWSDLEIERIRQMQKDIGFYNREANQEYLVNDVEYPQNDI